MGNGDPVLTGYELEMLVESAFKADPAQADVFAARCALRAQFALLSDKGQPYFAGTPWRFWLASVSASLYAWLWKSPGFPRSAVDVAKHIASTDAAGAADLDPDFAAQASVFAANDALACAACSSDADADVPLFAARAAANAADVADCTAICADIQTDLKAIQTGEVLHLLPLFSGEMSESFSDYLEVLRNIGFGYFSSIFEQIARGGPAAQTIFNQAESIFEDTESFYRALKENDDAKIEKMQTYPYPVADHLEVESQYKDETSRKQEINIAEDDIVAIGALISSVRIERTLFPPGTRFNADSVSSHDFLNRGPLMNALKRWLLDKENSENINLGLFGEWGAGKSTFLSLLKSSMAGQSEYVLPTWGEFNAWRYEQSENIQAGLAQEAVKALTHGLPLWQRIKLTFSFGWRTSRWKLLWLGFLVLLNFSLAAGFFLLKGDEFSTKEFILFGMPVQAAILYFLFQYLQKILSHPFADKLKTYLRLPEYGHHLGTVPVMHEQISLLTRLRLALPTASVTEQYRKHRQRVGKSDLPYKQNRFFFVVDDLDRCSPECVVQTLEAVRLVMDQPNVVVIIAIDQRIALASLAKHYDKLSEHHGMDAESIARDYLAKIIHIPIVLDRSSDTEIEGYLQDHLWKSDRDVDDDAYTDPAQDTSDKVKGLSEADILVSSSATKDRESKSSVGPDIGEVDSGLTEESEVADDGDLSRVNETEEAKVDADDEVTLKASDEVVTGTSQLAQVEENTRTVTGLCKHQKITFLHWVKRFSFSNPRQLKRLDNSYGLMRLRYEDEDQDKTAGRLVMLLWLEYLQLQPTGLRHHFIKLIKEASKPTSLNEDQPVAGGAGNADEDSSTEHECPLAAEHWSVIKDYLSDADIERLYFETRGFVLPAIEESDI